MVQFQFGKLYLCLQSTTKHFKPEVIDSKSEIWQGLRYRNLFRLIFRKGRSWVRSLLRPPAHYWLGPCQCDVTGWDRSHGLLALSLCGSMLNCQTPVLGPVREIAVLLTKMLKKPNQTKKKTLEKPYVCFKVLLCSVECLPWVSKKRNYSEECVLHVFRFKILMDNPF